MKDTSLARKIRECCEYGILAPSVHNLQPWRIAIKDDRLRVVINHDHERPDSDATSRQTWISVGCFIENVLLAAPALGLKASIRAEDYQQETIELIFANSKQYRQPQQILDTIRQRVSNRSDFTPIKLSASQLKQLQKLAQDLPETKLFVRSDATIIELAAELTGQAIGMALSLPKFKKELGSVFRSNISNSKTGIPGHALGLGLIRSIFEPLRFRLLNVSAGESAKEEHRMRTSAGLIFITTGGDVQKHWLRAGRLYQRAVLLLTEFGVSHSTTAAIVEAPDFHQEIERQLNTKYRLQAVVRYGKSTKHVLPSPRLSVDDILTSNA